MWRATFDLHHFSMKRYMISLQTNKGKNKDLLELHKRKRTVMMMAHGLIGIQLTVRNWWQKQPMMFQNRLGQIHLRGPAVHHGSTYRSQLGPARLMVNREYIKWLDTLPRNAFINLIVLWPRFQGCIFFKYFPFFQDECKIGIFPWEAVCFFKLGRGSHHSFKNIHHC